MLTWIVGLLLASGIGLSLGLIGGGGSVLALPILVYVMGVSPKPAIAMTLVIVGSVSLIGAIPHWRRGYVNLKMAALFGSATMLGAFLGAKIALLPVVTDRFQLLLFAIIMLVAAGLMIRRSRTSPSLTPTSNPRRTRKGIHNCHGDSLVQKYRGLWLILQGIGVGILTGLVGVGGGFMIVPTLVLLGNVPIREAIGTSLLVIALNSVAGFLGYLGRVPLDWQLMAAFTIVAGCGTAMGASLSRSVNSKQLQNGFGYFLLVVASFILFQNRGAFYPSQPPRASSNAVFNTPSNNFNPSVPPKTGSDARSG